jgi:hypothetical protein
MKFCKYHSDKRCLHDSCGFLDEFGNVRVCLLFQGGDFFASRKFVPALRPLFSKHARRK